MLQGGAVMARPTPSTVVVVHIQGVAPAQMTLGQLRQAIAAGQLPPSASVQLVAGGPMQPATYVLGTMGTGGVRWWWIVLPAGALLALIVGVAVLLFRVLLTPSTALDVCEDLRGKTKNVNSCTATETKGWEGATWAEMSLNADEGTLMALVARYEDDQSYTKSSMLAFDNCNTQECIDRVQGLVEGSLANFRGEVHNKKARIRVLFFSRTIPYGRGPLGPLKSGAIDATPSESTRAAIQHIIDSY